VHERIQVVRLRARDASLCAVVPDSERPSLPWAPRPAQ
jgi:hypothetical protein